MVLKQSVVVLVGTAIGGGIGGCGGGTDNNNSSDYQPVQGPASKAEHFIQDLLHKDFLAVTVTTLVMAAVVGRRSRTRCAVWRLLGSYGGIGVKAPWCPPIMDIGPSPGRWFAGGGGGGAGPGQPIGKGGGPGGPYAGGGNGANQGGPNAGNGVANSGGGGGSGCDGNTAGEGGSGIVIIRYQN